jgi:uncharacterized protein
MRQRFFALGVALVIGLASTAGFAAPAPTAFKLPPFVAVNSFEVGSSGFMTTSYATEGVTQITGEKFRILPATTDVARISALKAGSAHFSSAGVGALFASAGREEFASRSWGPQDLCIAWCAAFPGWGMVVRGDSGIKRPSDLKGKRVAYVEGWPGTNVQVLATLAFGGLGWKDVEVVKVSSHAAACERLLAGGLDTFNSLPTATFAFRIESASHGLGYIEHPFNDEEGWKRAREIFPFLTKYPAVTGAGLSKDKPLQTFTNANPLIVTYGNQDADLVYWLTRSLAEAYPVYSQKAEIMKTNWTFEWALDLFGSTRMPVHPGTIRYLKEINKWTPELEARNQERVQSRKALMDLWSQVLASSKKEKISDQDFPAYWEKIRSAAGPKVAW